MKLLLDENLPPRLARLLGEDGHDAVHVRDLDAAGSSDPQIIALADLLAACIEQLESELTAGAMVALTSTGARVRRLPLL